MRQASAKRLTMFWMKEETRQRIVQLALSARRHGEDGELAIADQVRIPGGFCVQAGGVAGLTYGGLLDPGPVALGQQVRALVPGYPQAPGPPADCGLGAAEAAV